MKVKVTDMQSGAVSFVNIDAKNPVLQRVMKRAAGLYNKAKNLGIQGIDLGYYVRYSWTLEKGKVWA